MKKTKITLADIFDRYGPTANKLPPRTVRRSPSLYGIYHGEQLEFARFKGGVVALSYGNPQIVPKEGE